MDRLKKEMLKAVLDCDGDLNTMETTGVIKIVSEILKQQFMESDHEPLDSDYDEIQERMNAARSRMSTN